MIDAKKLAAALRLAAVRSDGWENAFHRVANVIEPEPAAEPAPIPDDVREVVREALERSLETLRVSPMTMDARCKIKEALAALDASPPEKVVGYVALDDGSRVINFTTMETLEHCRRVYPGSRIVKLVEEPTP